MAVQAALLLGVLLLTHHPGDAGEAPRVWGWRMLGRVETFSEATSPYPGIRMCLRGSDARGCGDRGGT